MLMEEWEYVPRPSSFGAFHQCFYMETYRVILPAGVSIKQTGGQGNAPSFTHLWMELEVL